MGKAKNVLSLGGLFFVCQILYMIVANTNEFFISQYTSPGYVVDYQIYNKLFTLGSMIFMLTLTPIWSAVSKAIAEDNFTWVKKIFNNLKKLAIIGGIVEFALIPFLQIIINFWLGNKAIEIKLFLCLFFCIVWYCYDFSNGIINNCKWYWKNKSASSFVRIWYLG